MITSESKEERLFAYGTLRDPAIQREAFGRSVVGEADELVGFEKQETVFRGESYPIIVPRAGGRVTGEILTVTPEELHRIDVYEDVIYTRIAVTLQSGKMAWVYAFIPQK